MTVTSSTAPAAPSTTSHRAYPRPIALLLLAPCLIVLLLAASLEPSPAGMGTHQQMGLPPCGFLAATGMPCATCGMTTSFSHVAHGQFIAAFATQPAGAVLALLTAMAAVTFAWAAATGASLRPLGDALARPRSALLLVALILAGWIYTLTAAWLH